MTAPAVDLRSLRARVHRRLVDERAADLGAGAGRVELRQVLAGLVRAEAPLLAPNDAARLVEELVSEVAGLGPLEPLLDDPGVGEVMINGPGRAWVERDGGLEPASVEFDLEAIERVVERVVAPLGLRFDRTHPIVDARLADGSRLHAVRPPVAVDGPYVTIRRFRTRSLAVADFTGDPACVGLLRWAVTAGWNLLVSGGTSSGKTTLLNTLSGELAGDERIVTIEETAELRLEQPHVVRLEARPPNAEGVGAVSVRELVRAALRMRPDRIVIGEVRGAEAFDLVEALNTGHDGALSTIHANGPAEALLRLEALASRGGADLPARTVRAHITMSIDGVVHVARGRAGGRHVASVAEVGPPGGDDLGVRVLWSPASGRAEAPSRPPRRLAAPPMGPGR